MIHTFVVLIEVDAITLTPNSFEFCAGQDVVLTCNVDSTDSVVMNWSHSGYYLAAFSPSNAVSMSRDVMAYGYVLSLELTSRMPEFASNIEFQS